MFIGSRYNESLRKQESVCPWSLNFKFPSHINSPASLTFMGSGEVVVVVDVVVDAEVEWVVDWVVKVGVVVAIVDVMFCCVAIAVVVEVG